jgi:hypothetical protein
MTFFYPWAWRPDVWLRAADPRGARAGAGHREVDNDVEASRELVGYHVEAADGRIGTVDEDNHEVGACWVVVDTGPWILGKKVLLPAGVVNHVDTADQTVYVDRTKEQIKSSPEFDEDAYRGHRYRSRVGDYYTHSYRDDPSASPTEW